MATLIAPFYRFEPFFRAAHKTSPSKIILLVSKANLTNKAQKRDLEDSVAQVKSFYGKIVPVEVVPIDCSNLSSMAEKCVQIIQSEKQKSNAYIGGGPRILAVALLHACYARSERIERILCLNVIDKSIVELPKLSYSIGSQKQELLREVAKRNGRSISEIADKLTKSRGMVYQHLKELKEQGYIDEEFNITEAGRMAIL